ncbi:MAG: hypothetical protein HY321_21500, partial [Armatimonadetes bacterium]|nr:hypothetical protein [Armatimonadota bacterium]
MITLHSAPVGRGFRPAPGGFRPAPGERHVALALVALALVALAGCSNNPYPPGQTAQPVLYRSLADDPRTLDPSVSYTISESTIIDVIYSAYFRYHYLKRDPFVLELNLGAEPPVREPFDYTPAGAGGGKYGGV